MQEDAILVQKTLEGGEQAFHRLIMKYYTSIYALILSYVKNPEDAKDLTQEVFLEAYLDLGSLRHHEQFLVWLQQIARHQCKDWQRKRHEVFVPIDENMVCETPSADELLILQETLAKVMRAIEELPESESKILKERYLDDASYSELESRYGLSQSVLAMRLHRARQKVREQVAKMLSGIAVFSWQGALKKVFVGGVEAVKIGAKVKIVTVGVAGVLVLGGIGIIFWHHTQQNHQESTFASQSLSETPTKMLNASYPKNKVVSISRIDKPTEKQNKSQTNELDKTQDSRGVDSNSQRIAQPEPKSIDTDKQKNRQDEETRLEYEQEIESAKQQVTELIVKYGEIVKGQEQYWSMSDSKRQKMDPSLADNYTDARRETGQAIMIAIANYVRLTGDHSASYPGGWIYEFGSKNNFHIAHE